MNIQESGPLTKPRKGSQPLQQQVQQPQEAFIQPSQPLPSQVQQPIQQPNQQPIQQQVQQQSQPVEQVKQKKPKTAKQMEAFNKMLDAKNSGIRQKKESEKIEYYKKVYDSELSELRALKEEFMKARPIHQPVEKAPSELPQQIIQDENVYEEDVVSKKKKVKKTIVITDSSSESDYEPVQKSRSAPVQKYTQEQPYTQSPTYYSQPTHQPTPQPTYQPLFGKSQRNKRSGISSQIPSSVSTFDASKYFTD